MSAPAPHEGSWGSMLNVLDLARADALEAANTIPEAHSCGEPWKTGPDGELYCPWDGARYQG